MPPNVGRGAVHAHGETRAVDEVAVDVGQVLRFAIALDLMENGEECWLDEPDCFSRQLMHFDIPLVDSYILSLYSYQTNSHPLPSLCNFGLHRLVELVLILSQ